MKTLQEMRTLIKDAREKADRSDPLPWIETVRVTDSFSYQALAIDASDEVNLDFIASARTQVPQLADALELALEQLEVATKALEFYGNKENWFADYAHFSNITRADVEENHGGKLARQTLLVLNKG